MKTAQPSPVQRIKNAVYPVRYTLRLMLRPGFRRQARVGFAEWVRDQEREDWLEKGGS